MSKKLSQTERIKRHLLRKGIDYPAEKVVLELATAGVTAQMVYNVRSIMRQAEKTNGEPLKALNGQTPKAKNEQPLGEHIAEVIQAAGVLSAAQIAEAIKERGFQSNAQNFIHSVRMECERQVGRKKISRRVIAGGGVLYGPVAAELTLAEALVEPPTSKSVEPATTLGIDSVNLADLLTVQRLVRQIGGADKLQQHVRLLEELDNKPATELLEVFATKLVPAGSL